MPSKKPTGKPPVVAKKKPTAKAKVRAVARTQPSSRAATTPAPRRSPGRTLVFTEGLERVVGENSRLTRELASLAENVTFTVTTRTVSGTPLNDMRGELTTENFRAYKPRLPYQDRAVRQLEKLGFQVLRQGRFAITARGPAALVAEVLETPLQVLGMPAPKDIRSVAGFPISDAGTLPARLFLAPPHSLSMRPGVGEAIDHFVFEPPVLHFAPPSSTPPDLSYHHLTPERMRQLLGVSGLAETGAGVRVAVVDSGFYPHPFFAEQGWTLDRLAVPSADDLADRDKIGHGTAVVTNLFAIAPGTTVLGVPQSSPSQDAVEIARDQGHADVISCSWGWDREELFAHLNGTILELAAEGVILLFAAGNGQSCWPGSMPEILSIGGVYADEHHQLQASNFASGYPSSRYPGRLVPDVCGLCGTLPKGIYIPMPTQPNSRLDRSQGGPTFPDGDETKKNDGWCVASGTSSATPQIAGVVALLLERARAQGQTLTTSDVRNLLQRTATPVTTGRNAFGFPATASIPNSAVGHGLVNAAAALAAV